MMEILVLYASIFTLMSAMDVNGLAPFYGINTAAVNNNSSNILAHSIDHECRDRPDGYSAPVHGSKCRRYYRCGQKEASIYLCPGKNVFDGHRCVPPTGGDFICDVVDKSVESPDLESHQVKDCDGQSDGYYQDLESGCRSYFYCSNGLKAVYVCPTDKIFDGKHCVDESDYQCNNLKNKEPICKVGSEESYQADLSTGCRNYHFCSKDGLKLITLTCSDEKIFDGKKCVDPARYKCPMIEDGVAKSDELEAYYAYSPLNREIDSQEPAQKTYFISSKHNDPKYPKESSEECESNNGFFVIPGTGCRRYYFCIGGSRTELDCSGDSVFNGDLCVNPDRFVCPELDTPLPRILEHSSIEDSCSGTTSSGLYPDKKSLNCRGFVYCRMGSVYGPADECSPSQRFSKAHNRCLPKHEVPCPDTSLSSAEERS